MKTVFDDSLEFVGYGFYLLKGRKTFYFWKAFFYNFSSYGKV
ncbi:hypothetical protein HMPREF3187_01473 [Aerococcus christensenii]|uniref:Uncharacterized protein n=1 Tax=Aerococcus christensenii TaxID=87541 RepID=A0A133XTA0_9LACT|nr:hypothetical protein HMPREF3187_01473 [Aerococcus christensenii]